MTENIEELVREARRIDSSIKELTEQKTALVERIKAALTVGESLTVDGVRASLRPGNRKFSLKLGLDLLPEEIKLTCVSTAIDEKKVREAVTAIGMLDAAMEASASTVLDLAK